MKIAEVLGATVEGEADGALGLFDLLDMKRARRWWKKYARAIKAKLKTKVKILFSFYQIATRTSQQPISTTANQSLHVISSGCGAARQVSLRPTSSPSQRT